MRTHNGVAAAFTAGLGMAMAACTPKSSLLYVASYPGAGEEAGALTTLRFSKAGLEVVSSSAACGGHPSWLTQAGDILYCVDESWPTATGTLHSLTIGNGSELAHLSSAETQGGPVSIALYGKDGRGLAVADYAGGGIDTYDVSDPANIRPLSSETFPKPPEGGKDAQTQARPHQAVLDPTGDFLVFPDLGSDLLRVFKVDKETLEYTELESYEFERGVGPRHAAFLQAGDKTFLYVVAELENLVIGLEVTYSENGLSFEQVHYSSTHGEDKPLPEGTAAAEITFSPDNKFLTVSSRHEASLQFELANGTVVPSDPLITFAVDAETGALTHVQTAPAGGVNPRHFSFSPDGSRLASALQSDGRVVIFERDVATGKLGRAVAEVDVPGSPNFVMFKE